MPAQFTRRLLIRTIASTLALAPLSTLAMNRTHSVQIIKRKVSRKQRTLRAKRGEHIHIEITSDEPVSLHLHGYDIKVSVSPKNPGILEFKGTSAGRFPITSHGFGGDDAHGHHKALFYLEVLPK